MTAARRSEFASPAGDPDLAAGRDEAAQASAMRSLAAIHGGNPPEREAEAHLVLSSAAARRGNHAGPGEQTGRAAAIGRPAGLAAVISRASAGDAAAAT